MKKLFALVLALAVLQFVTNAWGQYYDPVTHLEIHWSPSEDAELGRAVAREFEAEHRIDRTSSAARRWRMIGEKLRTPTGYSILAWSFNVVADMDEANAFAFPGGPIYITPSLLAKLTTDDELAFVAAHEISHCTEHHYWNKVQEREQYNRTMKIALSGARPYLDKNKTVATLVNVGREVLSLEYSRKEEEEADRKAVALMARAGYHPGAAVVALEKLGGKKRSRLETWLSSHPDTPTRIKKVQGILARDFPDLKAYDPAIASRTNVTVVPGGYITKRAEFEPSTAFAGFSIRGEVQNPKERITEPVWYKVRIALIALKRNPQAPDGIERIELCSVPFDSKTGKYTMTVPAGIPKELADQSIVKCVLQKYFDNDYDDHWFGADDTKLGVPLNEFLLLCLDPIKVPADLIPLPSPYEKEVVDFSRFSEKAKENLMATVGKSWNDRRAVEHAALMGYSLGNLKPGWYRVSFPEGKLIISQDFTRDFPSFVGNVKY